MINLNFKRYAFAILYISILSIFSIIQAQESTKEYPFNSEEWAISGTYELVDHEGYKSLHFKDFSNAKLADVNFENGIIDYDLMVSPNRGFAGVKFRMQDDENCEEFYVRMHQSGNPDAVQYQPVYNGLGAWQLYHGENHSTAISFKPNVWMHIRLIIFGDQMEIYVDDMEKPQLYVYDLKRDEKKGYLGLWGSTTCYFANFKVTPLKANSLKSAKKERPKMESGTFASWSVSEPFSSKQLESATTLPNELVKKLTWKTLESDFTGVANLAKVAAREDNKNMVLAKIVIESESDQVKELKFGYSDQARIYFNNKVLYQGNRIFRSRDYRYLGTIGYFESIFLDLKKGNNEIVFAVSERFGGWGVMAQLKEK